MEVTEQHNNPNLIGHFIKLPYHNLCYFLLFLDNSTFDKFVCVNTTIRKVSLRKYIDYVYMLQIPNCISVNRFINNYQSHSFALLIRWIVQIYQILDVKPYIDGTEGSNLASRIIARHYGSRPEDFTPSVLLADDGLQWFAEEWKHQTKCFRSLETWAHILPLIYEQTGESLSTFAKNEKTYHRHIEALFKMDKWRDQMFEKDDFKFYPNGDIEKRIIYRFVRYDTLAFSNLTTKWMLKESLNHNSLPFIASILDEHGVRCSEDVFVYLAYLIVVAHGRRGLAALLVAFSILPRRLWDRVGVGNHLLYEALNLGFEHLGFVKNTKCFRECIYCGCKKTRDILHNSKLFLDYNNDTF